MNQILQERKAFEAGAVSFERIISGFPIREGRQNQNSRQRLNKSVRFETFLR